MTKPHAATVPFFFKVCLTVLLIAFFSLSAGAQKEARACKFAVRFAAPGIAGGTSKFFSRLLEELSAIKAAALSDDYAYHQLAHLTENIGPRPSGSPQAEAAVGVCRRRIAPTRARRSSRGSESPALGARSRNRGARRIRRPDAGTAQKVVLTALGGSASTPAGGLTADVVVVNNFDELKALGRDKVAGKIVLFNELFDKKKAAGGMAFMAYGEAVRYRGAGPKAAADLGAIAALVRSVGSANFRLPPYRIQCASGNSRRRRHRRRRPP